MLYTVSMWSANDPERTLAPTPPTANPHTPRESEALLSAAVCKTCSSLPWDKP